MLYIKILIFGIFANPLLQGVVNNSIYDYLYSLNNQKLLFVEDFHKHTFNCDMKAFGQFIESHDCSIISVYNNTPEVKLFKSTFPNINVYNLKHHISCEIYKDYHYEKDIDILLYGCTDNNYKFRNRLKSIINTIPDKIIKIIPHPGYNNTTTSIRGKELAILINQSKITICTRSNYDYMLAKYYETSMCKSLIAGDIPSDADTIFTDNIIKLDNNMPDTMIKNILLKTLENYQKHIIKRDTLYKYVKSNFTLSNFNDKLNDIIKIVSKIPKKIHMIWIGDKPIPKTYVKYVEGWFNLHPDYQNKLWKNEDITEKNFPISFKYLKYSRCSAQTVDIIRQEILYHHGGIYLDCDMKPIKNLNILIANESLVVCNEDESNDYMSIGFIASSKYNPVVLDYLNTLSDVNWDSQDINIETGPYKWMKSISRSKDKIKILPTITFYPIPYGQDINHPDIYDNKTYGVHMWGKNW